MTKSREGKQKISIRRSMDENQIRKNREMNLDISRLSNRQHNDSLEARDLKILLAKLDLK